MKHLKKINEGKQTELDFMVGPKMVDEYNIVSDIDDILGSELEIVDEPYSISDEPVKIIDYDSRKRAAKAVFEYLKKIGLLKTE